MNTKRIGHSAQLILGLMLIASLVFGTIQSAHAMGAWTTTGLMMQIRTHHTATLLPNGKVLAAAGYNGNSIASAELYDPATGVWTNTGGLNRARFHYTATLLPSGKVLVAGGYDTNSNSTLASAELYDPVTGIWTVTGPMIQGRYIHSATLLSDGKVLVVGGAGILATAELYDPVTSAWTSTGSMAQGRQYPNATLLPNGKVLVTGGYGNSGVLASAELYNPATGVWTTTSSMTDARFIHTATLLPNGQVLVAGGYSYTGYINLATSELYNPSTGLWTVTGSLAQARSYHSATLLADGQVLVAGGDVYLIGTIASAELYDSSTGIWTNTSALTQARYTHTATLLQDGKVLVAGGYFNRSAEVYEAVLDNIPPTADAGGPYTGNEGAAIVMSGATASDLEDILTYSWSVDSALCSFNNASVPQPNLTCTDNGNFIATLEVNDGVNPQVMSDASVTVNNVAPTATFANTSGDVIQGESATLAFSNQFDPGAADTTAGFLYSYDCTDDSVFEASEVSTSSFSCSYPAIGDFTARGLIKDKDGGIIAYTVAVTVLTAQETITLITDDVQQLVTNGILTQQQADALQKDLDKATKQVDKGKPDKAIKELQAFIAQVNNFISTGILTPEEGQPLIDAANEIIVALGG